MRSPAFLEKLRQDTRYALRGMRFSPTLTLTVGVILAICIGANTAVFSVVDSVLLRPLPFPAPRQLYWISERFGLMQNAFSTGPDYYSLRQENRVFAEVAAYDTTTMNWSGQDRPEQLLAAQVTPSFFDVFKTRPLLGRYFSEEEQGSNAPPVVVLSFAFWKHHFGGNRNVLGRTILLDGLSRSVIGVMPQGFDYPRGSQVWKPLDMDAATQLPRSMSRPMRNVLIVARSKAGETPRTVALDLNRLTAQIRREYPAQMQASEFLRYMKISGIALQDQLTANLRPAILLLSAAVFLVLVITCANLANLLIARTLSKKRELAVRLALGSGRGRIVQQVLWESVMLALPGGVAGALLAIAAVRLLNVFQPLALENYPVISLDWPTLAFSLGLVLLTGLVFGLAPAITAAQTDLQDALKAAGATQSGGSGAVGLRRGLIVLELVMSLTLLLGTALLARSYLKLSSVELGFRPEKLLTLRFNLRGEPYGTAGAQIAYYRDVLARVEQLPDVRTASVGADIPLDQEQPWSELRYQVGGRPPVPLAQQPSANTTVVSAGYFRTLGIPLKRGRLFGPQDTPNVSPRVLVNEALARQVFPGEDPIGKKIVFGRPDEAPWTIVGVVGTVRGSQLAAQPPPLFYSCLCQSQSRFLTNLALFVRTNGDPHATAHNIEAQIFSVDRHQPVSDVRTMQERLAISLAPQRFHLTLIGFFAGIALILSALGTYGVLSYLVARRRREIGIRLAVGAQPGHIVRMILRESCSLIAISLPIGLAIAWALRHTLQSMLYGIPTSDAVSFMAAPLALVLTALLASAIPARRAARTDPITTLRDE